MKSMLKVNASAVSYVGRFCADNEDNFYMNGRFMYDHDKDKVQVTLIESVGSEFLFAVSDRMDGEVFQGSSANLISKELERLQVKFSQSGKEVEEKIEKLRECVQDVASLIPVQNTGYGDGNLARPGFAGILVSGSKAAVHCVSDCMVYFLRQGRLKLLNAKQKDINSLTLEEGDVFLLCTNGLTDSVSDERIFEILSSGEECDYISGYIVKEAVKNNAEDNVTALVVSVVSIDGESRESCQESYIKEHGSEYDLKENVRKARHKDVSMPASKYKERQMSRMPKSSMRRQKSLQKYASTLVACLIIAVSIFGAFKLWGFINSAGKEDESAISLTEAQMEEAARLQEELADDELYDEELMAGEDESASTDYMLQFPTEYVVQKGDTLYQISRMFYNDHTMYTAIMEANEIEDPDHIKEGQALIIPEP
jgi:serine/threonine protein phosphatase PrpC